MVSFKEIRPEELGLNPFQAIGEEWMLVTTANKKNGNGAANPMTASWGGVGILWGKPVVYVFIRPQRYTEPLMNEEDTFSLAFLDHQKYQDQLHICGAKSGRDMDKLAACGFDLRYDGDTPYIAQAHTAIICRKLYRQQLEAGLFTDPAVNAACYPGNDHHYMYVAEITKVLVQE